MIIMRGQMIGQLKLEASFRGDNYDSRTMDDPIRGGDIRLHISAEN